VEKLLLRTQETVERLQPAAAPVLELRQRQAQWDEAHAAAGALSAFARLAAQRKLGPRPTLTL
jgi:hypothetical protein